MSNKFSDLGFEPVETVDSFDTAFQRTLGFEGGNTVDHAGATNLGVTQDTYNNWRKRQGLPAKSVRDIDQEEAKQLYKQEYFDKPGFSKLPANVAGVLFDFGVNAGTPRAAMALQKAVGASPDGVIGPKTLKAVDDFVNRKGEAPLLQSIVDQRSKHVDSLIQKNPAKYKKFEKGWKNRINAIKGEFKLSDLNPLAVSEASASEIPQGDFTDLGFEEDVVNPEVKPTENFTDLGFEEQQPKKFSGAEAYREFSKPRLAAQNEGFLKGLVGIERKDDSLLKAHPLESAIGEGFGQLMGFVATGGALSGVGKIIIKEGIAKYGIKNLPKILTAARVAQSGATFGAKGAIDTAGKSASGGDVGIEDLGKIGEDIAFGGALGLTGSIAKPLLRIPAEALFGFTTAKIQGADNTNAAVNGAVFGLFGALNRTDLNIQARKIAVGEIEKNLSNKLTELNPGLKPESAKAQAQDFIYGSATKITGESSPDKALEKVLLGKENNLKYLDELNTRVKNFTTTKITEGQKGITAPETVTPVSPTPTQDLTPQKPATPIERASQHGEVVGIDAKSGLPVIDTAVKPKTFPEVDRRNSDLIPQPSKPKNRLSDWTPILDAYDTPEGKRYQINKLEVSDTVKGKLLDHYGLLFDKPVVAAQTTTPELTPKQTVALAPATEDIKPINVLSFFKHGKNVIVEPKDFEEYSLKELGIQSSVKQIPQGTIIKVETPQSAETIRRLFSQHDILSSKAGDSLDQQILIGPRKKDMIGGKYNPNVKYVSGKGFTDIGKLTEGGDLRGQSIKGQEGQKEDVLTPSDVSTPSAGADTAIAGKPPATPLHAEALKYKTAEEFVKKVENESNISQQGKLETIPLNKINGSDYAELDTALKNGKLSLQEAQDLLPDNEIDMANSKVFMPIEVIKNADGTYSLMAGNHRVAQQLVNGEKTILANIQNEKGFSTKSQLTAIWNEAHGQKPGKADTKKYPNTYTEADKKDIATLTDIEINMPNGERWAYTNPDSMDTIYDGVSSGHSEAMQSIGPKESFKLLEMAQEGKPLTALQKKKVDELLADFRANIKPSLERLDNEIAKTSSELSESETKEVISTFENEEGIVKPTSQEASNITPSGQIRPELLPPERKELFQEEGELFKKPKGDPASLKQNNNDIEFFIDEPMIEGVKAEYRYSNKNEKDLLVKGANDFIKKYSKHDINNPIVGKFGDKVYFAPVKKAIERLGNNKAFLEYALHSVTGKVDNNFNIRKIDRSKIDNLTLIDYVIKNADEKQVNGDKIYYIKKVKTTAKPNTAVVLEMHKEGNQSVVDLFRYVTYLPNRGKINFGETQPSINLATEVIPEGNRQGQEPSGSKLNIPQNPKDVNPASLKPPTVSQVKAASSPQEFEKRIEQLNKFGQANAILRRAGKLKFAAGRYNPKANTVKIDEETLLNNQSYMQVIGHELGHAIEKNVTGKISQGTSGKGGFELFGKDADHTKIRAELIEVSKDLVSEATMKDKPEYYFQSTELIARFFEKMIFSPGNLKDLAPTAVDAIELQAIKHPIIQEFLLAATGGIDKGTPKFALLRDMRETYQKHLGKFVGNRAYDQEMVYRAMKERGKIVLEKFINDKMKMVKDSPESLFRAAESIKISRGGKPEFGTRDYAVAKTPEEEQALILNDYVKTPMPVIEDGVAYPQYAKQRYTPEEGKAIFESLSDNGKKLITDFTAERREAKDFFNREVIKETYKIKSQLEGWVHHYFEDRPGSTVMGGEKFKQKVAGSRKQRTGTEGYVEDFKKAMTKALVDLEGERVSNEFIPKMLAMVTKPLGKGQTPDAGWIEVVGNLKSGVGLPIEKRATVIDSATGESVPMTQSRYQMPKEIYERYKLWRGLIDEASTAVRIVNDLNRYWRINILTHPGTSVTNFISGGIQFSSKILTDFYREVLTGKLSMPDTQANISAMVKVLMPKGWVEAPDWVYGSDLSNFYGEFMKKKSPISESIDSYGNKALVMFGAVERYWKKVIMTADGVADLKSLNEMTTEGLRIPTKEEAEMIAAINESVDLYGYDYDNVPQWLEQHQKSVVGQAIKPFAKYPYKYAKQILNMVGGAFDQSIPVKDRLAKILALATIVSAYAAFSNDRRKKQKTPVADKSLDIPPRLSTRGRVFITTDDKGREIFTRVSKYPFFNLTETGMQFVDGNWSTGVDVLSDMLGSIGPAAAVGLMAFNYRSKYNQYEKPEVILGDNLATFLPGYRILNDVSRALDPFQRKQETFGQTFTQIIPTTDQALQEKLHGKIRTERVPIEGDVGLEPTGSRTTVDVPLENVKEDILLSLFTGVYRTRLDPKVVEAYIIRKQKNLDKKNAKQ